ncbi:S41 family peptidase [Erythrobacter sp. YT30]|uniref:S41 family peptidase n=1 Tax=Erythrobacter sp. YT30 TaxID=1735012 RepID=UPI00076C74E5|nr:S41 family peptidase [Erythrobacter sp. YT30]KWV92826.1 hypothetical protein AUC45_01370 [Erythrobacter sp. YT30]
MKRLRIAFLILYAALGSELVLAENIDDADRAEIIDNAATLLRARYVDPELGAQLAQRLPKASQDWQNISDPEEFGRVVTQWLREQSRDGHLGLSYSATPISEDSGEADYSAAEMERWYGPHRNHGVEKIERLDGNIMLLDLRVFPPPSMAADVIAAAMTVVAQGEALIIDLRKNSGGAETANLITGYLLDEGEHPLTGTYNRPKDRHSASTSPSWVPGRKFGGTKPLYILTSHRTFSAAEALAYNLQALGRATIVGEVTGGGAHPFEYRRVHEHFALDLPEGRSINPITGKNWQNVGVRPDIQVSEEQALEKALDLAREAISSVDGDIQ